MNEPQDLGRWVREQFPDFDTVDYKWVGTAAHVWELTRRSGAIARIEITHQLAGDDLLEDLLREAEDVYVPRIHAEELPGIRLSREQGIEAWWPDEGPPQR